jgi:hypothetical protein
VQNVLAMSIASPNHDSKSALRSSDLLLLWHQAIITIFFQHPNSKIMARINDNFLKLKAGYLFPEIGRRVGVYTDANPDAATRLIRCGIGDVTEPLPEACRKAMHDAVDEQGDSTTFRGYGPEQGYDFLREAIVENQFAGLGISADEVFVSDGSKCDTGNILDIFGPGNKIAITDPVYPVYVDTNVMIGNTGRADENGAYDGLVYLPCTAENGFVPAIPEEKVDLIYLCYPNNPTGATATREQLSAWVAYAKENKAIIFYDAAYEAFIQGRRRSAFHIRNRRSERVRNRVSQLFEKRRLHRHPLRLHRDSKRARRLHRGRHRASPSPTLVPPPQHQVQWRELSGSARSRSRIF